MHIYLTLKLLASIYYVQIINHGIDPHHGQITSRRMENQNSQ
jgi:hypothetical protein